MAYSLTSARSDCLRAGLDRCGSRWRLGSPSARRWFIAVSVPDDISRRLILEELAGPPCGASATAACTIFSSACAAAMVAMECALPACVPAAFANRPSVPFILVLPRHAMRARRGPAWCLVEVCQLVKSHAVHVFSVSCSNVQHSTLTEIRVDNRNTTDTPGEACTACYSPTRITHDTRRARTHRHAPRQGSCSATAQPRMRPSQPATRAAA